MYLVTDVVDGTTWADAAIDDSDKLGVIEKLVMPLTSSWARDFARRPSPRQRDAG